MHQLINKKNRVIIYITFFIILSTVNNKSLIKKNFFVPHIDIIDVKGLSKENNSRIEFELDKILSKNIFFINKDDISEILKRYNLVEKFKVKKVYPKQIIVEIEQTEFIAQIKGENSFLIGSNGKLITNNKSDNIIPFLFGKFDSKQFLVLKKIMAESEFDLKNFSSIFFYPSNRWDLQTTDDILIKLPKKNLSSALKIAYKVIINDDLKVNRIIDLRVTNHLILR